MTEMLPSYRRLLIEKTDLSMPMTNGSSRLTDSPSYVNDSSFDANMVIILAALLCALIGALGVNSIVRCALRCSYRFASETPEQAAARVAGTGLKKRDLGQIPVGVYGSSGVSIKGTECPICLGEFEDGDKVRVLPKCNHGFHVRCIDAWLVSHSSCPNCRHSLLDQQSIAPKANRQSGNGSAQQQQQGSNIFVVIERPS